ncbi:MAG: diguanylate cyclase [Campylobacterota bacterium]|nr:diguanylate cyclase [Campylobacterota bacterium]
MTYDFSNLFHNNSEDILDEFIDKYTSCVDTYDDERVLVVLNFYKKIISMLNSTFKEDELLNIFENLARYKISLDVPYILTTNEINSLETILISKMTNSEISLNIIEILSLFKNINNRVAHIYLIEYINKLISLNNIRISSLSDLIDKKLISHYESHLIWLTKLAQHIKDEQKDDFVELNSNLCGFGKWLHTDAKNIIQNNSKLKSIDKLHANLHIYAKKIYSHIGYFEHHLQITYLEKCELISLSIGTELALIDNILMNKKVTKDALTEALNRNGLRSVFESQYELSLATNNSFVLAVCDLDNFKKINDTYGHIAGDKILQSFVNITKEHIRTSDVIIRYGGEEFVIILPAVNQKKGFDVLQKLCNSFEQSSIEFEDNSIKATVSIGMMEVKPKKQFKHTFIDEYIMIADQRLYRAKNAGKNRVESSL